MPAYQQQQPVWNSGSASATAATNHHAGGVVQQQESDDWDDDWDDEDDDNSSTTEAPVHFSVCFITMQHTRVLNSPFSRTTRVTRYQKGKTSLDFTEARDSEWQ